MTAQGDQPLKAQDCSKCRAATELLSHPPFWPAARLSHFRVRCLSGADVDRGGDHEIKEPAVEAPRAAGERSPSGFMSTAIVLVRNLTTRLDEEGRAGVGAWGKS